MNNLLKDAESIVLQAGRQIGSSAVMSRELDATDSVRERTGVSVVIPTYNSAHYLESAVKSVFEQRFPVLECIVVDDGSTDQTGQLLDELSKQYPRLKTARKGNGGPSSARNVGLGLCSGDLVAFLDADDIMLPDKIARQVEFFEAHTDVGLVYSDYLVVSEKLKPLAVFSAEMPPELDPLDAFCYRNWFNPSVTLIRRTVIDRVVGFDEELQVAEDWDYWIRCAKVTRFAYLAGPVALYRQHPGQMHRDHLRMRAACMQVATKSFRENHDRLRASMAVFELTHAKYLWKHRSVAASFVALMRCVIRDRLGLHKGRMLRQLAAIVQSQLRPF